MSLENSGFLYGADFHTHAARRMTHENASFGNLVAIAIGIAIGICLAKLKQLNHKDHEDRKEKSLRGLCGLSGNFPKPRSGARQ
jgi:hypothetical protein